MISGQVIFALFVVALVIGGAYAWYKNKQAPKL